MANFGAQSLAKLKQCHPNLQSLFATVIKGYDCKVTTGYRSAEEQQIAFDKGNSEKKPGESKHNIYPSIAIDVYPYPIDYDKRERFYYFAGYVLRTAEVLGIKIRWGGDWDSDKDLYDQHLFDLVHFELV